MPTNVRYRTRGPKAKPDADLIAVLCGLEPSRQSAALVHVRHLLTTRHTKPASDDALAAWHAVRKDMLPRWIAEHPGTRPLAWWRYEAPSPMRRIVQGHGRQPRVDPLICGWPENLLDRSAHIAIESQAAYLKRNGLLTAEEEHALPPEAFTPQAWTDPVTLTRTQA